QGEGHTKLPEKQRAKDEPGKDGSSQHLLAGETGKGREPGDGSYQENVSDGLVHAVVTCGVTVTSLDRARWSCRWDQSAGNSHGRAKGVRPALGQTRGRHGQCRPRPAPVRKRSAARRAPLAPRSRSAPRCRGTAPGRG